MNKQQTAVDYLVQELIKFQIIEKDGPFTAPIIERAKEIEKEQTTNFANEYADQVMAGMVKRAQEYYEAYAEIYEQ